MTVTATKRRSRRALPARKLFNVDEYYRMAEAGILHEDDHVELIDGEIIEMAAMGSPHAGCVSSIGEWLVTRLEGRAQVRIQMPLRLSQRSEPEPDLILVRPRSDHYRNGHPGAEDVYLLVEVADTSLNYDRRTKLPLYAREGVPEVWLVNLPGEQVEANRRPQNGQYQETIIYERGTSLAPSAFLELSIAVDQILG